ncbi:MAG: hypothetical protein WCT04_27365 [Planctomycetota bacterium]
MPHITLAVTQAVLAQVAKPSGGPKQRQIAIRNSSPTLAAQIATASAKAGVFITVNVSGQFALVVGDTGAVWASHQANGMQSLDFNDLYTLLSRRPDINVTFSW